MNIIKITCKSLVVIAGFVLFYIIVLSALTFVNLNGCTLLQFLTANKISTGSWGQSLVRFREAENIQNVDILFIGSSHAYRGFDPRLFKLRGYSSFNIGSTAQTPLNTYYLLKYYLKNIKPKVIIFELYPAILSSDGYESTLDLLMNVPISLELLEMSIATNNPNAVNNCISRFIYNIKYPLEKMEQKIIVNDNYISGGYVETDVIRNDNLSNKSIEITCLDSQLVYISKIMKLASDLNIELIAVIQPLPIDYLSSISNYKLQTYKLKSIANEYKYNFFDFNDIIVLNPILDYKDIDHLNKYGVIKFNNVLLDNILTIKHL